ncbi:hypothetical protein SEA_PAULODIABOLI_234 [Microbacterium phage PauloDiaboli]|nr:hypothetical protein SEA_PAULODIABOLI_234 [Microbacterium phage PauloDiaboli]
MFPSGVTTREIKVGPASDLLSGAHYTIKVMISPSRTLVWDGSPVLPSLTTVTVKAGEEGLIELPVTDQEGYADTRGNPIQLEPGDHAFYYKISVYYLRGGSVASKNAPIRALLPAGAGPVDVDEMLAYSSSTAGGVISVPDKWTDAVVAAQAAAEAAAASAEEVSDALQNLDEFVGDSVDQWFENHPTSVVSPETLAAAIQAHEEDPEPHKAYDLDIPSLSVMFENGLV